MILPRNNVLVTFSRKDLRSNIRLATHCTPPRISFPQAALQLYFSIDWSWGGECEKFHKNLSIEVTWLRTFFHSVSIIDWNKSFSLSRIPCSSLVKHPNRAVFEKTFLWQINLVSSSTNALTSWEVSCFSSWVSLDLWMVFLRLQLYLQCLQ